MKGIPVQTYHHEFALITAFRPRPLPIPWIFTNFPSFRTCPRAPIGAALSCLDNPFHKAAGIALHSPTNVDEMMCLAQIDSPQYRSHIWAMTPPDIAWLAKGVQQSVRFGPKRSCGISIEGQRNCGAVRARGGVFLQYKSAASWDRAYKDMARSSSIQLCI